MAIFKGSGVALVTPFKENLEVDYEQLRKITNWHVEHGTDAIIVCGTTGEASTLTEEEHSECIAVVAEEVNGRIPVIAGTGSNATYTAVKLSKEAEQSGVDGLLVVTPYYNKATQNGLIRHYTEIANAVSVPIIMYNVPSRTGCHILPATAVKLAKEVDNIVAIKEATGVIEQVKNIIAGAPEGFCVYSGDDSFTYDLMKAGGAGVISTISNVATKRMKEIVDACAAGNWDEALELNAKLLPLMEGLFATTNPILVKEALALVGFPVGGVRLPLVDATPEQSKVLEGIMREVGVL